MFCSSQIIIITNFVLVSSVGKKRVDRTCLNFLSSRVESKVVIYLYILLPEKKKKKKKAISK